MTGFDARGVMRFRCGPERLCFPAAATGGPPEGSAPPWVGPEARSVVYASWEDEREEAGRRLAAMADDGITAPEALAGRLRFVDLRSAGPLWAPAAAGFAHVRARAALTATGGRLRATCEELDAALLVVDSLAGAYAGDENTRALVRAFCAHWDAWATETGCAVMLVAHPPKAPAGAAAGALDSDYAGSTDWHNAARWRWALEPTPTGRYRAGAGNRQLPVTATALKVAKSSYGPSGACVFVSPSASKLGWEAVSAHRPRPRRRRRKDSTCFRETELATRATARDRANKKLMVRVLAQAAFTSTSTPRSCRRRRSRWVMRCLSRSSRYLPPSSW